jgi:predicted RND superfamily exporter protein
MKPLLLSGLTTAIGFITLAWSYNPALRGLGLLCGLGVGWCLLTAFVFVLPACALLLRRPQQEPVASPLHPEAAQK